MFKYYFPIIVALKTLTQFKKYRSLAYLNLAKQYKRQIPVKN